jgi:hypothetical protein
VILGWMNPHPLAEQMLSVLVATARPAHSGGDRFLPALASGVVARFWIGPLRNMDVPKVVMTIVDLYSIGASSCRAYHSRRTP